jgi:hypothetical protein
MQIVIPISNHPALKKKRAISLHEISVINFKLKYAKVLWEEVFLDDENKEIKDETVSNRIIESIIDNSNTVTAQGIVIDSDNFPKMENEDDEKYIERIDKMKSEGYPEFEFYINAVLNTQAIGQAILILDNLKRFNRK